MAEFAATGTDVSAGGGDQGGGDLPVGPTGTPVITDFPCFLAQGAGMVVEQCQVLTGGLRLLLDEPETRKTLIDA